VDRARHEFFAGSRFPVDEHRRVAGRDLRHASQNFLQRGRRSDNLLEHRRLVDFFSKSDVFLFQSLLSSLPVFNIGTRPVPSRDLPFVVAHRVEANLKPSIASVTLAYAHLHLVSRTGRRSTIGMRVEAIDVFRMNRKTRGSLLPPFEADAEVFERGTIHIETLTRGSE
jgi:hypothetical protein